MPLDDPGLDTPGQQPVFRVDGAHRLGERGSVRVPAEVPVSARNGAMEPVSPADASSFCAPANQAEQLQVQAEQLARHLQDRRRDVDYREAQLNARIAQLENELRLSRLWYQEQNQEFAEREEGWRTQLAEQERRAAELVANQLTLDESRRQLTDELRRREDSLARREFEVLESQQRLATESTRLIQEREHLDLARKQLEHSRLVALHRDVADQLAQLRRDQEGHLSTWQREHEEAQRRLAERESELASTAQSLTTQAEHWQQEREQQQQALEEQRLRIDQRQLAVERTRADMLRLHRESLEMRLIAEQLWSELVEHASPADVSAGMTRLRSQLADTFRLATTDLERQRQAIGELVERLDDKHRGIVEQRRELLGWFAERQRELAQQAMSLREQEQQLAGLRHGCEHEREAWRQERRQMQCEIADLQAAVLRQVPRGPAEDGLSALEIPVRRRA